MLKPSRQIIITGYRYLLCAYKPYGIIQTPQARQAIRTSTSISKALKQTYLQTLSLNPSPPSHNASLTPPNPPPPYHHHRSTLLQNRHTLRRHLHRLQQPSRRHLLQHRQQPSRLRRLCQRLQQSAHQRDRLHGRRLNRSHLAG